MIFLHRQNVISDFSNVDGIELDVRSINDKIYLNHDRLQDNTEYILLEDFLKEFPKDKTIIFNTKEANLEEQIIEFASGIDFYFLDSQIPDIIRLSKQGIHKFIIRVSPFETLNENLIQLSNPKYIWLDYNFDNFNIVEYSDFLNTIPANILEKTILVSPELYSLDNVSLIEEIRKLKNINKIKNVCSKFPERWKDLKGK